jgi:hypothetical protein
MSWITLINTSKLTKRMVFYKGGNIISRGMKTFSFIKENKPQQILILPRKVVKRLHKNGTIRIIKHAFVWHIIYEQHVASMNVKKHRKENVKVKKLACQVYLVGNTNFACKTYNQTLRNIYRDFCFMPNSIQIIINIVLLGCGPNIHMELCNTFL